MHEVTTNIIEPIISNRKSKTILPPTSSISINLATSRPITPIKIAIRERDAEKIWPIKVVSCSLFFMIV